jgi:hypothetical protein
MERGALRESIAYFDEVIQDTPFRVSEPARGPWPVSLILQRGFWSNLMLF